MLTLKPARGTVLNPLHPLSRGMVGGWLLNEGQGIRSYDISGNGNTALFGGVADPPDVPDWIGGSDGYALDFIAANSDWVSVPDSPTFADLPDTGMSIIMKVYTTSGSTQFVCRKGNSPAPFGWAISHDTTGRINFGVDHDTTDLRRLTTTGTTPPATLRSLALTYPGNSVASDVHIYSDGIEVSSYQITTNGVGAYLGDAGDEFRWGRNAYSVESTMVVEHVYLYNRALSPEEVYQIALDPYQMCRQPLPAGIFYVPAGVTHEGVAALDGIATVAAAGVCTFVGASSLTGTGTVAAAGVRDLAGVAALDGTATVAASGVETYGGAASLTGTATITATGVGLFVGAASLVGSATVTVVGTIAALFKIMKVAFGLSKPAVTFTMKTPSVTFSMKIPQVTFAKVD